MYVFEICVFLDYIRPGDFKNPSYASISPAFFSNPLGHTARPGLKNPSGKVTAGRGPVTFLPQKPAPPHQKSFLLPLILSGCPQEAYNLHY